MDFEELIRNLQERIDEQKVRVKPGKYLADCPEAEDAIPKGPFRFPPFIGWDNNHFPCDYALLLRLGLPEIVRRAEADRVMTGENAAGEKEENLLIKAQRRKAVAAAYRLIMDNILRYAAAARALYEETGDERLKETAKNCEALCAGPPATFCQGVQLIWFIFQLRGWHRSSLGRLDQALWPLYESDILARNARDEARAILAELWENFNLQCSGDTLMNLMLGGTDREGRDASNDLSLLMMQVTEASSGTEPHVNVRVHRDSPEWFLKEASRLIAQGRGQGVLYFDEALVPSFIRRGIPAESARNYANDGCTEITFNGESAIAFWQMEMMKSLELTLFRGQENPNGPKKEIHKWSNKFGKGFVFQTLLTLGHDSGDVCAMEVSRRFTRPFLTSSLSRPAVSWKKWMRRFAG